MKNDASPSPTLPTHQPGPNANRALRCVFLVLLTLFLGSALCQGQTPTPTPTPPPDEYYPMPSAAEDLPEEYQPRAYDPGNPTVLQRLRFKPNPQVHGEGPWPAVVIIPACLYREAPLWGPVGQRQAFKDLTDAGYLVFSVNHRSAPFATIKGQPPHDPEHPEWGRPPQQANDIMQQIMAARHDSDCNGETVFVIGASSGGTHAMWAALATESEELEDWGPDEMPEAVACLSGGFDLSFRDFDEFQEDEIAPHFKDALYNYTKTCCTDTTARLAYQLSVSPISLLTAALDNDDIPPLRMFTTFGDPMPYQLMGNMVDALEEHLFTDYEATMVGNDLSSHAFQYWHTPISGSTRPWVSDEVIDFFNDILPP